MTRPAPVPGPPTNASPAAAVRLLAWGWGHRDLSALEQVFTDDSVFVFALRDSAGIPSRDPSLTRAELLCAAKQLFQGGGAQPPATSIFLALDPALAAIPDSRPGRNPAWHREILTSVDLQIRVVGGQEYRVSGHTRFFLTRGDSAKVPAELVADSTRWYIERWEEDTPGIDARPGLARPQPAGATTWGTILSLYRCD